MGRLSVPCFPINGVCKAGADAVRVWFSQPYLDDTQLLKCGAANDLSYCSGKRRAKAIINASVGTSASAGISRYTGAQMLVGGGA